MSTLKTPINTGVLGRQKNLHTFSIDFVDNDGTRYSGRFTTKRLSIADIVRLGVRKSEINGGYYYDPEQPGKGIDFSTDELAAIIAHLEISLKDFPKWWNLEAISSVDVLTEVYQEVASFEESFSRQPRQTTPQDNGSVRGVQRDSGGNLSESDVRGVVSDVVDEEVQASLEP